LTTYPNKTYKKLFYFEKEKFQKNFPAKFFGIFWKKQYFFVFGLELRTNKKSYQKSVAMRFFRIPLKILKKKMFLIFDQK